MSRVTGKTKWFNDDKGYGFIEPDDKSVNGGKDVFVHVTALNASKIHTLNEGDAVEFDIIDGRNGKPQASNLARV